MSDVRAPERDQAPPTPGREEVLAAVETLRAAGWRVRKSTGFGVLYEGAGGGGWQHLGQTVPGRGDPDARTYRRVVLETPWEPVPHTAGAD